MKANPATAPNVLVWRLTGAPAASGLTVGMEFTGNDDTGTQIRSFANGTLRAKPGAAVGTYTFVAFARNSATGCEGPVSGTYTLTKNPSPAAITPIISDVTFCADAPDLQREVRATVPTSPVVLVWEVVSAPAASGLSAGTQFTGNDNSGTQLRSFAGGALRAKPGAAVGTYMVEAFGRNTTTGCEGPRTTFTLTKNALPTETITADGLMTVEFCPESPDLQRQVKANPATAPNVLVWRLTGAPAASGLTVGMEFTGNDDTGTQIRSFANGALRAKPGAAVGTYTFVAFARNSATGCEGPVSGTYTLTKNPSPAAITPIISDVTFCADAPDLQREVRATVPASPVVLVWEVVSAPAASGLSAGTQFTGNDNLGTQLRSFAGGALRAKPGAAVGTYMVEAFGRNTTTGCEGPRTTFTLTKNALPTETITADGLMTVEFCPESPDLQRQVKANPATAPNVLVWRLTGAPAASGLTVGMEFTGNDDTGTQIRSFANGALRAKPGAAVGTYMFVAFARNSATGCEGPVSGTYTLTKNPSPAAIVAVGGVTDVEFCDGAVADDRKLRAEAPTASGVVLVWKVVSVPAGSSLTNMSEFMGNSANQSDEVRSEVNGTNAALLARNNFLTGTYTFEAFGRNTTTGCEGPRTTFTLTKNAVPAAIQPNNVADNSFCGEAPDNQRQVRATTPAAPVELVWEVVSAPMAAGLAPGTEFTGNDNTTSTQVRSFDNGTLRIKPGAAFGTYTFTAFGRNTTTGCEGPGTTFTLTKNEVPAAIQPNNVADNSFCGEAPDNQRQVRATTPAAPVELVWEVVSAPMAAGLAPGTEFTGNDNTTSTQVRSFDNGTLRIKPGAAIGTYIFTAFGRNTTTGCEGPGTTFTLTKNALPADFAPAIGSNDVTFCSTDPDLQRQVKAGLPTAANEILVWRVVSVPGTSNLTVGQEFLVGDNSGNEVRTFTDGVLRIKPGAEFGTYEFVAFYRNSVTGCNGPVNKPYSLTRQDCSVYSRMDGSQDDVTLPRTEMDVAPAMDETTAIATEGALESGFGRTDLRYELEVGPNPFQDRFTFKLSLQAPGRVSAELIGMDGRVVQRILTDEQLPAGTHTELVDAPRLTAGTYLLRISVDGEPLFMERLISLR